MPSTSVDGSAINKTGNYDSDAALLLTENHKRDAKRNEYSVLTNFRYRPKTGESMEEMSMRLAKPQRLSGAITAPGLAPQEIQEITGEQWTQESYIRGLEANKERSYRRTKSDEIGFLRTDYLSARKELKAKFTGKTLAWKLSRLEANYKRMKFCIYQPEHKICI